MKLKLTLLFAFFSFINLQAQNYQVLSSKGYKMFKVNEYGDDFVKSVRVDSVKMSGLDSVFFLNKELKNIEGTNNFSIKGNSFLGNRIIVLKNKVNAFLNVNSDTIKIKTDALLSESWTFYQKSDTVIKAKIILHEFESFLGVTDSVKTIQLSFEKNGLPQSNPVDAIVIKLSKNYGLISVTNLNDFPSKPSVYNSMSGYIDNSYNFLHINYLMNHTLYGQSFPEIGVQNLTKKKLHNFNIGDEFHFKGGYSNGLSCQCVNNYESREIEKIIDKIISGDTIIYKVEITGHYIKNYKETHSDVFEIDTIVDKIFDHPFFDELPYIPYTDPQVPSYEAKLFINKMISDHIKEVKCMGFSENYEGNYGSLIASFFKICEIFNQDIYDRIPETYDESFNNIYGRDAVYYNKSGNKWGTPLSIKVGVDELSILKSNTPFPNPSNGIFNFIFQDDALRIIVVFDVNGNKLYEAQNSTANFQLDLSHNSKGVYFYQITSENKMQNGKLIIQ